MDKIEQNKILVEHYPFLFPRNVWTGEALENYDYSYIEGADLPRGWGLLFLQMCEDIRQPLIDANYLDKFRFTQIKEKYNTMRLYHCGAPEAVNEILRKYEAMSSYICTQCGRLATIESQDYIASFCDDCWKKVCEYEHGKPIEFKTSYTITGFKNGEKYTKTVSFENELNRYLELIKDDEI